MRRVFYNADAPRMYSDEEIDALSAADAREACNQMDQNIAGVLQQIDTEFMRANQLVASQILPTIERYGENSQVIWESVKFWKSFFEASGNARAQDSEDEEEAPASPDEPSLIELASPAQNNTEEFNEADNTDELEAKFRRTSMSHGGDMGTPVGATATDPQETTPRPPDAFLRHPDATPTDVPSVLRDAQGQTSRARGSAEKALRRSLGIADTPITGESPAPSLPDFETVNVGAALTLSADSLETPQLPLTSTPRKPPYRADAAGGASTPPQPPLTDLSKTPLSAFRFKSGRTPGSKAAEGGTARPGTGFVSARASLAAANTPRPPTILPSKSRERPSPLPPIPVYTMLPATKSPAPRKRSSLGGFSRPTTLSDFAETGVTQNLDDLLGNGGDTFFRLQDSTAQFGHIRDDTDTNDDKESDSGVHSTYEVYDDNGITQDFGRIDVDGPEDTLFGLDRKNTQGAREFKVMGMSDIHTLHGGDLLESQPFVASPLANRDRRDR